MLHNNGITKATEEVGELIIELGSLLQTLGKYQQYPDEDHPDTKGNTKQRLEEEVADVMASLIFMSSKLKLDTSTIQKRMITKLKLYRDWDKNER